MKTCIKFVWFLALSMNCTQLVWSMNGSTRSPKNSELVALRAIIHEGDLEKVKFFIDQNQLQQHLNDLYEFEIEYRNFDKNVKKILCEQYIFKHALNCYDGSKSPEDRVNYFNIIYCLMKHYNIEYAKALADCDQRCLWSAVCCRDVLAVKFFLDIGMLSLQEVNHAFGEPINLIALIKNDIEFFKSSALYEQNPENKERNATLIVTLSQMLILFEEALPHVEARSIGTPDEPEKTARKVENHQVPIPTTLVQENVGPRGGGQEVPVVRSGVEPATRRALQDGTAWFSRTKIFVLVSALVSIVLIKKVYDWYWVSAKTDDSSDDHAEQHDGVQEN